MFISCIFAIFMGNVFNLCDIWNKTEWIYKHVSLWEGFYPSVSVFEGRNLGAMPTCTKVHIADCISCSCGCVDKWIWSASRFRNVPLALSCFWLSAAGKSAACGLEFRKMTLVPLATEKLAVKKREKLKTQKALGLHLSCLQHRCTLKYEPFWCLLARLCTSLPLHWWGTFFLSCTVPRAAIQCSVLSASPRRDASVNNICYLLSLPHEHLVTEQKEVTECWYQRDWWSDSLTTAWRRRWPHRFKKQTAPEKQRWDVAVHRWLHFKGFSPIVSVVEESVGNHSGVWWGFEPGGAQAIGGRQREQVSRELGNGGEPTELLQLHEDLSPLAPACLSDLLIYLNGTDWRRLTGSTASKMLLRIIKKNDHAKRANELHRRGTVGCNLLRGAANKQQLRWPWLPKGW